MNTYENKRLKVVKYLVDHRDPDDGLFIGSLVEVAKATKVSYRTITITFDKLRENNYLTLINGGIYRVDPKLKCNLALLKKLY